MTDKVLVKPKIEAIYQLSIMQNALLFHHLTEKEDQGFLNVQCNIDGDLDINLLKKSWDLAIERHPVLRTSVHWEKVKSPVQVVIANSKMNWTIIDWSKLTDSEQQKKINELKKDYKKKNIDFQKEPLSKISLIKTETNSYYFIWSCHHLLLDGWSSSIIMKDVFAFYDALFTGKKIKLDNIPSYKSYLNWLNKSDSKNAKDFWVNTFKDFDKPFLFDNSWLKTKELVDNGTELTEATSLKAKKIAKAYQITLNTLFQSIWSLIISKYSNSNDITYGNTVSGRSGEFPNIELIAGMFSNVIPVRTKLDFNLNISEWLKNIQTQQIKARNFEHITVNEITEWIDISSNHIFDSLFVFENFPWNNIKAGNIIVYNSKSGITSTYPLTLTIKPSESINIHVLSDTSIFSQEAIHWILNRFDEIINIIDTKKDISIKTLYENISSTNFKISQKTSSTEKKINVLDTPRNQTENEILRIWKDVLSITQIGINDNFFELGGKSLLAIKMFSKINGKFKTQLAAKQLIKYPTISKLSDYLLSGSEPETWNNIVPIQSKGDKNPLFCIHAGGGHVFFYGLLKDYLKKERPIYALEPSGLNQGETMHKNVEAMAVDYLKDIRKIQPTGPYNILVYCFSTTVGNEISILLQKAGEEVNIIVIDTLASSWGGVGDVSIKARTKFFFKRLVSSPIKTIKTLIYERSHLIKPFMVSLFGKEHEKKLEKVQANLRKMSIDYKYKPHNGNVSLILTHKEDKKFENYIIDSWKKLAKGGVDIYYTKGNHFTLFEKPDIEHISKQIDLTLKD